MSDFETELAKGQPRRQAMDGAKCVVGCATAVAPLAVALALGTAIAHADTYAERGGGVAVAEAATAAWGR